jgi:hypothetical protein
MPELDERKIDVVSTAVYRKLREPFAAVAETPSMTSQGCSDNVFCSGEGDRLPSVSLE